MKRKNKIAIGCLSAFVILILAPSIYIGVSIYTALRPIRQAKKYIHALSDAEIQRWITRTENILASEDSYDPSHYEDLPEDMRQKSVMQRLHVYSYDDYVIYHWCIGIACADLTVRRLPEGGHEIMFMRDTRIYPKEDAEFNREPHEQMADKPQWLINAEEVAFVIVNIPLLYMGHQPDEAYFFTTNSVGVIERHEKFMESFRITNRDEIVKLVSDFNNLNNQPEGGVTWSGSLSSQMFVSTNNSVLVYAFIIMNTSSCVLAGTGGDFTFKDGSFFGISQFNPDGSRINSDEPSNRLCARGHEYATTVLEMMRKYHPHGVLEVKKFYQKIDSLKDKTVDEMLGLENKGAGSRSEDIIERERSADELLEWYEKVRR